MIDRPTNANWQNLAPQCDANSMYIAAVGFYNQPYINKQIKACKVVFCSVWLFPRVGTWKVINVPPGGKGGGGGGGDYTSILVGILGVRAKLYNESPTYRETKLKECQKRGQKYRNPKQIARAQKVYLIITIIYKYDWVIWSPLFFPFKFYHVYSKYCILFNFSIQFNLLTNKNLQKFKKLVCTGKKEITYIQRLLWFYMLIQFCQLSGEV